MIKKSLNQNQSYFLSMCRIVACFGSFIVHFGQLMFSGKIRELTDLGALGVCMFFILTGFLGIMKFDVKKEYSIKKYYYERAIRILPLYYFWIFIYFLIYKLTKYSLPVDEYNLGIIRYIFILNDIIGANSFWFNVGATWTINFFVTFYLIIPFISKIIDSYKKSILLILFGFLLKLLFNFTNPHLLFLNYAIYFFSGIIVYYALKENKLNETGLISLLIFFVITKIINSRGFGFYFILFVAMLCIGLQINLFDYVVFSKNYNFIKIIDKYTYTFYLTHCFFVILCGWVHLEDKVIISLLTIIGSIITTFFVYNYIELPIKRFIKKICYSNIENITS